MSQWTSPGRIVTGLVSAAALVVALASMTGTQRAQSLGLTRHGQLITAQDAGAADAVAAVAVTPGTAGQVLTVSDAGLPHWSAAPASTSATTLNASDCVAEAGSESASISGTGDTSTFTVTASATARAYGSGGATAARIVCVVPAGTRRVEVQLGPITAQNGFATGGNRYLGIALRNAANGGAPSFLWGASHNDAGSGVPKGYVGGLMGGANSGATSFNQGLSTGPLVVDGWIRHVFDPWWPLLGIAFGTGSGGARPASWTPINTTGIPAPFGTYGIADPANATAVVVYLQSFGGGGATSLTARLSVRTSS